MSTDKTIKDMALLGGHPVLDFINTVDARRDVWGPDLLTGYADLLSFAGRTGVIGGDAAEQAANAARKDPAAAKAALEAARSLRETLYRLCLAEAVGMSVRPEDLDALSEAVRMAKDRRRLDHDDAGFEWRWQEPVGLDLVTQCLALAAANLLVEDRPKRRPIRECPGRNCGWLFLDTSRGGRRHWCSERTCGTPSRVRKFRAGSGG